MPKQQQKPYCLALILCDAIHQDPATRKFTLLGTFNRVRAKSIPIKSMVAAYFAISDGMGDCEIRVKFVKASEILDDDEDVASPVICGKVHFDSPLDTVEAAVHGPVSFPTPGLYVCQLWCDDECLMERSFEVLGPTEGSPDERNP